MSTDRGVTWPELKPSAIAHPSARFFITRLSSGNLLLVKHGPIDKRTDRSHLTAYVSTDDGRTWGGGLLLDERGSVSYPDGQQTADGLIRIIYDFSRTGARHILMATFREEDVAAGRAVSDTVRLRQLVSDAAGGLEPEPPPVAANQDGEPLRKATPGELAAEGALALPLVVDKTLFTDRGYVLSELPAALQGVRFLRVGLTGQKKLRCSRAGTVFFLTPAPDRNRDSMTQTLLDQGFRKVALPEVRLFNPSSTANFCTLYQKDCAGTTRLRSASGPCPSSFPDKEVHDMTKPPIILLIIVWAVGPMGDGRQTPAAEIRHQFLAVDESRVQLHYVDQTDPSKDFPASRRRMTSRWACTSWEAFRF